MALTLAVVGPTASGKTRRAVALARHFNGEIISGDSRQLYRRMDLGTGKDLKEYQGIPYHLIDVFEPGHKCNLHQYLGLFRNALADIESRGKTPVFCGGTGMYVENALCGVELPEVPANPSLRTSLQHKSLDELTAMLSEMKQLHNTTDVDTCQRAIRAIEIATWYASHPEDAAKTDRRTVSPLDAVVIGIDINRETRRSRISRRLKERMEAGMAEEIKALLDEGVSAEDLIYYGLEYKYITLYVTGQLTRDEALRSLEIAIHQFAKRQMTWWRGMERRGIPIHWLPFDMEEEDFIQAVNTLIDKHQRQ